MELAWWIGAITLLVVAVWLGVVAVWDRGDTFVAPLVSALLLAMSLVADYLTGRSDLNWGLLMLAFGAVGGGLLLRSWWWPWLCPFCALVVWWGILWVELHRSQGWSDRGDNSAFMWAVIVALLGAVVLAVLAAIGVALGRRLLPPDT